MYSCNFLHCNFRVLEVEAFWKHLSAMHEGSSSFLCGINSCPRTYSTVEKLKDHVKNVHIVNQPVPPPEFEPMELEIDFQNENGDQEAVIRDEIDQFLERVSETKGEALGSRESKEWDEAKFLLKLKESSPQYETTTKEVKESVSSLLDDRLREVQQEILQVCTSLDIDLETFESAMKDRGIFTKTNFDHVSSTYLKEKYFRNKFGLITPEILVLGEIPFLKRSGDWVLKQAKGYFIDPMVILQQILHNPFILEHILKNHISLDGVLRDICDGRIYQQHPCVQQRGHETLQIIAYFDDIEVTNPLSSKTHKVGCFYWFLGNIPPNLRSRLKTIFVFAVARSKDIREFGIQKILVPFVRSMNLLSHEGIAINFAPGFARQFYGAFLGFLGDTLASQYIGGFKEGVGGAYKICRECDASRPLFASPDMMFEEQFTLRSLVMHLNEWETIGQSESKHEFELLSLMYGINELSELTKIY
eukprot:Pompholyxophrys_punicea_v1_NODE_195_length_2835_cov_7.655148.p1 type:complete len:475 gc:universal NODE_195_length_2835_cov_7.655148:2558-1134(-)